MQITSRNHTQIRAFVAALSLALFGGTAQAQDSSDAAHQEDPGQLQAAGDHFIVGLGAAYGPAYQGASKYRTLPLPAIDVKWRPFFANLRDGVGVNIIDTDIVTAGTSITFLPGYRRQDAPPGIGGVSAGAGGRVFVDLKAAGFIASIGGTRGITGGTRGVVADASLYYPIAVSPRFTLVPKIGATWADSSYNNRYFGVNYAQSLASGLAEFQPGSGFKDASMTLSANYCLTRHLMLGVSAGATTLLDKVKDSPIVFHKTQPTGFLSMSYRFGS